jgi:hypothetical protein
MAVQSRHLGGGALSCGKHAAFAAPFLPSVPEARAVERSTSRQKQECQQDDDGCFPAG